MTRRIEAGPVLVALGALLLVVSVFLDWYDPSVTAWEAFEVLDLLMVVLSLAAIVAVVGTFAPSAAVIDRRSLPPTAPRRSRCPCTRTSRCSGPCPAGRGR